MNHAPLLLALLLCSSSALLAQKEKEKEEIPEGWRFGVGIGLDVSQLLNINPRQGAAQNRLGLEGAFNSFANLKRGRQAWDNTVLWQFGLQRIGSGTVTQGSNDKVPFQKTIDEIRLASKYGIQIRPEGRVYYSVNGTFMSQILPTYQFPDRASGNYVTDFLDTGRSPRSKFLSPATATASLGIDYKPVEELSIFFSPLSSKFIIVANDSIAARGVHGNEVSGEANAVGIYPAYKNVDAQLGALLQVQYKTSFLTDDRATFTSNLTLYANYLRDPQNVDVDWLNGLSFALTEHLQINLFVNAFYDDNIRVQVTDNDQPNGTFGLGQRVSITQQLLISYARTF
ncbi:DUF3078 domain-containing protein [Neolewinella sp.]|uniref:DUF3078 domain-containing protein n=1 Tax=Neolewinella sp. TaxID=2993543 RepID=UPI003B523C56